ncbi:PTS sugar transporter subunit IIC [Ruoffia tabacinasalis]|uniref:PTS sugar transporter subunit IIC n=1 Tax=Ruoffia tabacinasalis TaxID=87458 RepID=A0A5R9DSQ1_9LACT|nr:PTS transporter subunit IIC [Ruoffia tabacinasalis]TLQ39070.1 PTS sugar transporter subunit IIC [Ruoffia tabacinasalis]
MDAILNFFDFVQSLGVAVMMPIVIFIIGLVFKAGVGTSLRAGLTVGVGFIGLNLVINNLLGVSLAPAVQDMVARFGLNLSTIDVGWPATAAIALGSTVGIVIIPLGLIVNIVMLLTNTTQTVNVDIWDYWHFAFTGALVAILTENVAYGIIAAVINMVIIMVLADVTAPEVEKSLNLPGVSLPHGFTTAYAPIAIVLNKIIDLIPGINKIDINTTKLQEKFGVFGEPIMVGTLLGVLIGIVAGYNIPEILTLGISLGAVLVLIPKMAALLMEGLIPISDTASQFIQERFSNRGKIYIGLDSAIGVGHPVTMAISLILVPIAVFLAVVLPGNTVMPFGDLATIPWMFVLITPIVKENGFRALIIGILMLSLGLLIATDLAPLMTSAALDVGFNMPEGTSQISSIVDGANPLTWVLVRINEFGPIIGLGASGLVAFGMSIWNRNRIIKEAKLLQN